MFFISVLTTRGHSRASVISPSSLSKDQECNHEIYLGLVNTGSLLHQNISHLKLNW